SEKEALEVFAIFEDAGYSFNKCLSGDTYIPELGMTLSEASKLDNFDNLKLTSLSEKNKDLYSNSIEEIFFTGNKEVFEIELYNGEKIECTLDHKFLCTDGKFYTIKY